MLFRNCIYIIAFLCPLSCTSQQDNIKPGKYLVDKNILQKVEKFVKNEEGMLVGQMDIRVLENDKEVQNTFGTDKKVSFFTTTNISNDIIMISAHAGMFAGFGFELYIWKDSCVVLFDIATDDPDIYKLNKTDSTYKTGVQVPTISSKVILSRTPDPKGISKSNPLEVCVELESGEFYEKSERNEDKKLKFFITAYFKTEDINKYR